MYFFFLSSERMSKLYSSSPSGRRGAAVRLWYSRLPASVWLFGRTPLECVAVWINRQQPLTDEPNVSPAAPLWLLSKRFPWRRQGAMSLWPLSEFNFCYGWWVDACGVCDSERLMWLTEQWTDLFGFFFIRWRALLRDVLQLFGQWTDYFQILSKFTSATDGVLHPLAQWWVWNDVSCIKDLVIRTFPLSYICMMSCPPAEMIQTDCNLSSCFFKLLTHLFVLCTCIKDGKTNPKHCPSNI